MKRDKIEIIVSFLIILVAFSDIPPLGRRISISILAGVIIIFALYAIHRKITNAQGSSSSLSFSESRPTRVEVEQVSNKDLS